MMRHYIQSMSLDKQVSLEKLKEREKEKNNLRKAPGCLDQSVGILISVEEEFKLLVDNVAFDSDFVYIIMKTD